MSKGINPNLKIKTRSLRPLSYYLDGMASGDRYILSEVLTLVESLHEERRALGQEILAKATVTNRTVRIGITGSPGAGKSTFIEAFGTTLADMGHKVAVLAVDPSSTRSQGSILGDKTRMSALSTHDNAFVRPTASANMLGGVARATKESITLCEAAGYDVILVESVGVGQSETDLADLVDTYLLLMLPGGGDGVQGIKRGVVELADIMVVNKNDGDRQLIAQRSRKDYAAAVRLFHHELKGWQVPVELCSALEGKGIVEVWSSIQEFLKKSKTSGFFQEKRNRQDQQWIRSQVKIEMMAKAEELFGVDQHLSNRPENQSIFETLQAVRSNIETVFERLTQRKK